MSLGSLEVGWQSHGRVVMTVNDGGGAVSVTVPAGWYATPAALEAELTTQLQLTWGTANVDAPVPGGQTWFIDLDAGAFSVAWGSTDLRHYMGFSGDLAGETAYQSDDTIASTWYPLTAFQDLSWRRVLTGDLVQDHTGRVAGNTIGSRHDVSLLAWVEDTDYLQACAVLRRLAQGARGTLRLDRANANAWAWTAAGWTGQMSVARIPGTLDLDAFLTEPWTGIRGVRLTLARW